MAKRLFRYLEVVPFVEYGGIGNSITTIDQWLFSYGFATHIPFKFSSLRIEKPKDQIMKILFWF